MTKIFLPNSAHEFNHDLVEEQARRQFWKPYFGNHHEPFPCEEHLHHCPAFNLLGRYGGGVSFGRHIGQPLGKDLWWDIVARIKPSKLLVYKNQEEWTMGWGSETLIIRLDGEGVVRDIEYFW